MSHDVVRPEDETLIRLAQRLGEGAPIDWDAEREQADAETRPRIEALAAIAAVANQHREASVSFDTLNSAAEHPTHWRHLVILETLGRGQFGTVYRAFDPLLQLEVALKLSDHEPQTSPDASRIVREARLLARISHPHVVRVYGADQSDGRTGVWMALVAGKTLDTLGRAQRFSASEATTVGLDLCRALAAVHGQNVLHGDVKPNNVIRRDEDGRYVLVDFGAGRPLSSTPTAGNDTAGTLVYMAPEVLQGGVRSRASDIYSLGVVLYHLVTDAWPVFGASLEEVSRLHADRRHARLRDLRPDLPAEFITVIEKATAFRPDDRYQTAAAFEAALLGDRPVPARAPWATWVIGGLLVVGGLGVGIRQVTTAADDTPTLTPLRAAGAETTAGDRELPVPSFAIEAAFYRRTPTGREKLDAGKRLRVGDALSLTVHADTPVHVYVVNEDEQGHRYLLFPPKESASDGVAARIASKSLPPGVDVRVPAADDWQVTSEGGLEHLLVFASVNPLAELETLFATLPSPQKAEPLERDQFRGLGGLTQARPGENREPRLYERYLTPLQGRETARGVWVRQLVLESTRGK